MVAPGHTITRRCMDFGLWVFFFRWSPSLTPPSQPHGWSTDCQETKDLGLSCAVVCTADQMLRYHSSPALDGRIRDGLYLCPSLTCDRLKGAASSPGGSLSISNCTLFLPSFRPLCFVPSTYARLLPLSLLHLLTHLHLHLTRHSHLSSLSAISPNSK